MADHCVNPCDHCGADLGEDGGTVCDVCRAERDNPPPPEAPDTEPTAPLSPIGSGTATYSPEDNKLRLYVGRVPRADYDRLRAAGYTSTPKQSCDFVATWTPHREDLALEFCEDGEDIGDEDYSPQERSADRAERFSDYRDRRATEAGSSADRFDSGPAAFGHQNRQRAERQAARHNRHRAYACSQWSKAEYWQSRTEAVISHALYKSSPAVRRSRILVLEAELRKLVASYTPTDNPPHIIHQQAYNYTKGEYLYDGAEVPHVWVGPKGRGGSWVEVAALESIKASSERWHRHYENRLAYERAMLAAEGGTVTETDMEPGGWIKASNRTGSVFTDVSGGWMQVHGVNRSPATGRVVSVKVMGTRGYRDPKPGLVSINVERLGEDRYRAPTDEEREAFKAATIERKAKEKASKPKAPPLINPTDEDAERLQAHWNARAAQRHKEWRASGHGWGEFQPTTIRRMTQAEYSAKSKGSYGNAETVDVCENGFQPRRWDGNRSATNPPVAFKVRKTYSGTNWTGGADAVIVITDKPQKPLPLDWDNLDAATVAQPEAVAV